MSIDTLFLSLIIFLLLMILLREHARTAGTPRAPTLEGALDALAGSGVLPGGVAEILRYTALRRRRDRYPILFERWCGGGKWGLFVALWRCFS